MDNVSLVLAIGAALTLFGGIIQAIVAGIEIKKHSATPRQKKIWLAVILVCIVVTAFFGGASYTFGKVSYASLLNQNPSTTATSTGASLSPTSISTGTSNTVPVSVNKTPITTSSTSASTNYSAPHPGTGCDTGGGTWTMQGFSPPFTCDTELSVTSSNARAYLFFNLPKGETFSPDNRIGITRTFVYMGQYCFGLAEQDAKQDTWENTAMMVSGSFTLSQV